ncbi:MAG: heme lyase CcmF/NrfE family subunit [Rhodocyclaceae bacterium]|nr:heme lyase CcmF/NrfE family subunit [Rhodocyclaceae bacterium]
MVPELGHFALIIALVISLVLGTLPIVGAARGNAILMSVARPAGQGFFVFMVMAYGCLAWSFLGDDFSVVNVASNSNSSLPLAYKFAASWGSHEGSLLLWTLMLSCWTLAVTVFSKHLPEDMVARVLGVMGLVACGFLLFMLLTSNPFERILPAAADGRDLNPLLQDPGMVIHPPMLYMGYVGFSVAFAFSIAALLGGRMDAAWARWSRPWTTVAWIFLTLGIAIGSWWAYYELGWGGWWFWDPVENASFMPWLVGTALIHSLAVTEKRGSFKSWTVLLAIAAFSLSLLGTFLVRSGVLTSVHAFATDPRRGVFILALLVLVIGSSLALFAWRAPKVGLGGSFGLLSRESLLLTNNVLLSVAAGSVLLGTLYPLFLDALGLGKISVGPPYFDSVFVPLMVPILFLMAVGPVTRWKQQELGPLARKLTLALVMAIVLGVAAPVAADKLTAMMVLSMSLAFWIFVATGFGIVERIKASRGKSGGIPMSFWGMQLAHVGVAVFVVGVAMVNGSQTTADLKMKVGDTTNVAGYVYRFDGISEVDGPNYIAARGTLSVTKDGKPVTTLHPEKRIYRVQRMPMTEAAIDTHITHDLYVSLGEAVDEQTWIVRIFHKPFVVWIWGGCVLMALGGLLAAMDRRYRKLAARDAAAQAEAAKPDDRAVGLRPAAAGSQGA